MTEKKDIPSLTIGSYEFNPPIIQGGMGVRVSASGLASAVSNQGGLGVLAAVGTGEEWPEPNVPYLERSYKSFREMIQMTREKTDQPFGVNIMCALTNYDDLVRAADEEEIDVIISGAGLPLKLPGLVKNPKTRLVPVVSSARAAKIICSTWKRKFDRLPDAVIVEGSEAGGHLGYSVEDAQVADTLFGIMKEVIETVGKISKKENHPIPVIAAGGVFDGADIARYLKIGASGVQMGTRFVCTHECDAALEYKQAYIDAGPDDIGVIKSPLGLPLRVVRNDFVKRVVEGDRIPFKCSYRCLAPCNPGQSSYCIAQALVNAYRGEMEEGFVTCGANAWRIDKIVSVKELMDELTEQTRQALATD
jgi:nitronate monooxygenase